MTKRKQQASTAAEAVRWAIEKKQAARGNDLKAIEIVKVALCAYQGFPDRTDADTPTGTSTWQNAGAVESDDRAAFRHGKEAALDRVLFNVNYWRSAYEDRIVTACTDSDDARTLLHSIAAWNSHTMRLNRLSADETRSMFERFCPPLSQNKRRGSGASTAAGKGPVPDFTKAATTIAKHSGDQEAAALETLVQDVKAEAAVYQRFEGESALDTYYDLLPVWCLQDRIELVQGSWWDDPNVMGVIAQALYQHFLDAGHPAAICGYYLDSFNEALDSYNRDISTNWDDWRHKDVAQLLAEVREARENRVKEQQNFEIDGYGPSLPAWLSSKEQLIWNTVVCAIYGPEHARPFLPETAISMLDGSSEKLDVITDMAQAAYGDYLVSLKTSGQPTEYSRFEDQPDDLRDSMLAQVESFHDKLAVLGYHMVPAASCYPEQRIDQFTPSEIECLAVLEHRRWLAERKQAGWRFGKQKDTVAKQSPYLVAWEDLPERARECNRRAVRNIPALLASVKLAISR